MGKATIKEILCLIAHQTQYWYNRQSLRQNLIENLAGNEYES